MNDACTGNVSPSIEANYPGTWLVKQNCPVADNNYAHINLQIYKGSQYCGSTTAGGSTDPSYKKVYIMDWSPVSWDNPCKINVWPNPSSGTSSATLNVGGQNQANKK